MRALVDDTPDLQYKVELHLASMVETQPSGDVHDARVELRRREEAWNKFQPLQEFDVSPLNGRPANRNFLVDHTLQSATFVQLSPTPLWGLPLQWSLNFHFPVHRVHVYPEDNLLFVVEPRCASSSC